MFSPQKLSQIRNRETQLPSPASPTKSSVRFRFIGLLARILSDVGRDLIDFAEFRKRVENKCTPEDSRAFYEFQQRRGKEKGKVEKTLEGIYACCFRRGVIEEEDEMLLQVMLTAVFPSVDKSEIKRIIKEKATRVAQGGEEENLMKRLPKKLFKCK